jgi:electron transfer flavoprotein alpha subunit
MLKVTKFAECSMMATRYLAEHTKDEVRHSVRDIADAYKIPLSILASTVLALSKAQRVASELRIARPNAFHSATHTEQGLLQITYPRSSHHIEELIVSESIAIGMKRAAIALVEELDYASAAEQLHLSSAELRKQVAALETLLCLRIFKPRQKKGEPTEEGQFIINVFRKAVAFHDLKEREGHTRPGR